MVRLLVNPRSQLVIMALVCGLLTACGGGDEGTSNEPVAKPRETGDPRPRIEGRWRVVYTPDDLSQEDEPRTARPRRV